MTHAVCLVCHKAKCFLHPTQHILRTGLRRRASTSARGGHPSLTSCWSRRVASLSSTKKIQISKHCRDLRLTGYILWEFCFILWEILKLWEVIFYFDCGTIIKQRRKLVRGLVEWLGKDITSWFWGASSTCGMMMFGCLVLLLSNVLFLEAD